MPVKASGTGEAPRTVEWPGGITWLAHPTESMQRASHALADGDEVWLVDPVDGAGIDEAVARLGAVAGIVVLLDRHTRDAATFARRHDVAVHLPDALGDAGDALDAPVERFGTELGETGYRSRQVMRNRFWREAALVSEDGDTVVVPEALGTAPFYTAPDERVAVNPALRLWPPRRQLGDLDPERLLVGHGWPVLERAGAAMRDALGGARRRAPRAYWHALRRLVGAR